MKMNEIVYYGNFVPKDFTLDKISKKYKAIIHDHRITSIPSNVTVISNNYLFDITAYVEDNGNIIIELPVKPISMISIKICFTYTTGGKLNES